MVKRTEKPAAALPVKSDDLMQVGGNASAQLLSIVERIERLEEEQQGLAEDKKEVYSEAKGNGYDAAVIRKVISRRKMDAAKRQEAEAILDLYETAIGEAERTVRSGTFGGAGAVDE